MVDSLRKDYEKTISELERYRLLIESVQDYAIYLLDASGYIETWNSGAENIKGYAAQEVIGKHFSLFYTPKDITLGKPDKDLLRAAQHGRIEDEYWHVRKDGSHFWASAILSPLVSPSGVLIGFAKITRDTTERKKNQDALLLANKMYKRQHMELEALNSIKDEFISLASHQLRTPATGIKQFLGILLEGYAGKLTKKQLAYIQKAYDSNERQIELVNSLLRTAQVDAGKTVLKMTSVDLSAITENVIEELKDVFKSRQQTITIKQEKPMASVILDEQRIRMVLENLIDNASKYSGMQGRIIVGLSQTKKHIVIYVQDNGIGIDTSDIKSIFDKFHRISNVLSDSVGGSGLGLYWVKKIVDLHKGDIVVTSSIGVGTKFKITIPKDVADE